MSRDADHWLPKPFRGACSERLEAGDARHEDGRLGHGREPECLLRAFEADATQREAKDRIGPLEDGARRGLRVVEGLPHPDGLRALTREDEGRAGALHQPHVQTAAPHVRPVPKAANRRLSPLRTSPWRVASSSATGMEAAEVLPTRWMFT